ncbi:LOW QUALITY PROTEIN: tensin-2-like [Colius striatus]|uniref:LOW QUALITY PROTEIN: tensin-2-like n=1 Tax=Colius striatus TaxID=57412 RepID=UPI002B1DBEC3|nr:LOW QUALITY PROTEIN: tensin-2-like [Colius striatus]
MKPPGAVGTLLRAFGRRDGSDTPPAPHSFREKTFRRGGACAACGDSLGPQGLVCRVCKATSHKRCEAKVTSPCQAPPPPEMRRNTAPARRSEHLGSTKSLNGGRQRSTLPRSCSLELVTERPFALDLTYVTERILALRFPRALDEPRYRQHLRDVAQMLGHRHGDKYTLFNLSEKRRDISSLNPRVQDFGWPDLHAPTLEKLCAICQAMERWLQANPQHVAVLHCKGSRGKAGVVVAAYMHYSQASAGAAQALGTLSMRKFYEEKVAAALQPSQQRYVELFRALLSGRSRLSSRPQFLHHVLLPPLPAFAPHGCQPFLKIYQSLQLVYTSGVYRPPAPQSLCITLEPALLLKGDVMVTCFHRRGGAGAREPVFRAQFHSGAVAGARMELGKGQLDGACADERFPPGATVEFIFSSGPERIKEWVPPHPPVPIDYALGDAALRRDSYQGFNLCPEDSPAEPSHTRGPLDGSPYARVQKPRPPSPGGGIGLEPSPSAAVAEPLPPGRPPPPTAAERRELEQLLGGFGMGGAPLGGPETAILEDEHPEAVPHSPHSPPTPQDSTAPYSTPTPLRTPSPYGTPTAQDSTAPYGTPTPYSTPTTPHGTPTPYSTPAPYEPPTPQGSTAPHGPGSPCSTLAPHSPPAPYGPLLAPPCRWPSLASPCPCHQWPPRPGSPPGPRRGAEGSPEWRLGGGGKRGLQRSLSEGFPRCGYGRRGGGFVLLEELPPLCPCQDCQAWGAPPLLAPPTLYGGGLERAEGSWGGPAEALEPLPCPHCGHRGSGSGLGLSWGSPRPPRDSYGKVGYEPPRLEAREGYNIPGQPDPRERDERRSPGEGGPWPRNLEGPDSLRRPPRDPPPQQRRRRPRVPRGGVPGLLTARPPLPPPQHRPSPRSGTRPRRGGPGTRRPPPQPVSPSAGGTPERRDPPAPGSHPPGAAFVQDTTQFWYKPALTRDQAVALLRAAPPGSFLVRRSRCFPGAFGLALRVPAPAPCPAPASGDPQEQLVRHFLIETGPRGVKVKGGRDEPHFGSLPALVLQHSITPISLPCALRIPTKDLLEESSGGPVAPNVSTAGELLRQGAACSVLYLGSVPTESLTGPQAVAKAVGSLLAGGGEGSPPPAPPCTVQFKVSARGITLTDSQRRLFFRRHYPVSSVTHCSTDPQGRRWAQTGSSSSQIFGFVARQPGGPGGANVCHLFAELDPEQPAAAIAAFVSRVLLGTRRP